MTTGHTLVSCPFAINSVASDFSELVGAFRAYGSPVIAILGLLGNALIITIFAYESPRTRFSIFALSLAICHSVCLIANTLMDDFFGRGLYYATNGTFTLKLDATSVLACKLLEFIPHTAYFAASYLIVMFSIDRTLTIYKPLKFHACKYWRLAVIVCVMTTVVGVIGNMPLLLAKTVVDEDGRPACRMDSNQPKAALFVIIFTSIITFCLPVFIVFALNVVIIARLWKVHKWRRVSISSNGNSLEFGRATGHIAMSMCFLLLYIPLSFVVLVRLHFTVDHEDNHTRSATRIVNLSKFFASLKDISYAVNCLIYVIFLANFRARFMHLCGGPRPQRASLRSHQSASRSDGISGMNR